MSEGGLSGEVNPWVMSSYITYSTILLLKLISNIMITIVVRMRTKIVSNPEDRNLMGDGKDVKVAGSGTGGHPLLTRVQRMHQNDMESIIPFFMLGFLFAMTWYSPYHRVVWHFRIFAVSRLLMSFCHFFAIQPFRTIFFLIAHLTNISMAGHILYKVGLSVQYF